MYVPPPLIDSIRDLFDVYCLLNAKGINKELKHGFIMALLSHPRAIHEILQPKFHNQEIAFVNQFQGMTIKPFTYKDFEETRKTLLSIIPNLLTEEDKRFLLSFKSGTLDWALNDIKNLQDLPAIKWKLINIGKLMRSNPSKHLTLINKLESCLNSL